MITNRSTYDEIVSEINAAAAEVAADSAYDGMELPEDEVWADLASSYLIDASEATAREVCRVQLGYMPGQLERHFADRRLAEAERRRKKDLERRTASKKAKEDSLQAAVASAAAQMRANRCGVCFTVRTPSGACNC
jgi:beta-phosphoglucomutase-like phosphatase (HAD superfamily)